ncbi:ABC transporter permease [Yonghaparkia sp. Soil809]|uniref:ABC transporter permease n=1 Tax=Yonghaparkia sp. Soil809 TaxID=1736417 RepID=UPI0006FD9ED9|nr:ABC transporter permease [Yonghaparkia sp. Soil809]KRF30741.1 hypothetical protein ASG83_07645 [Yonghaparkia sp. Soil809]
MSESRTARPPLRLALLLAARNARRSVGRSILIALMIAVPVAGMSATAVVVASSNPTPSELAELHLADAGSIIQVVGAPGTVARQAAFAPLQGYWDQTDPTASIDEFEGLVDPASVIDGRVVAVIGTVATLDTGERLRQVQATAGDVFVDELAGRFDLVEGHAPERDRELVVSPSLADELGLAIGDAVSTQPDGVERMIVGIGRSAHDPDDALRVFGTVSGLDAEAVGDRTFGATYFALDADLSWYDVLALNDQGLIATSREIILGGGPYPGAIPQDPLASFFGFQGQFLALAAMIGAFLLLQVVLLAGAAFMVGARQQQRSLAVLASVGADRRLMRTVVTTGGLVLGLVGSALGVALGVGAAAVFMELTRSGSALQYAGFHVDLVVIAATIVVATGAGWLAAVVPSRVATRVDIVAALRGARRPPVVGAGARRAAIAVLVIGAAVLVSGGALLVVLRTLEEYPPIADGIAVAAIALGAVILQLGAVLALPMVLRSVARATSSARTSVRLAARDSARNSGRTVPVAAAVMTTVFLASFLMSVFGAVQLESEKWYTPQAPMNAVVMSVRTADPTTSEFRPIDDVDAVLAGVAEIADSEATLVEGVYIRNYWGFDERSGAPILPPEGTETLTVALDVDQVCLSFLGPPVDASPEELGAFDAAAGDDPRCAPGAGQILFVDNPFFADSIRVGDPEVLEAATGMTLTAESRRVLDGGGVVAIHPEYVVDGEALLRWVDSVELAEGLAGSIHRLDSLREVTLPAAVQVPPIPVPGALLMLPETARALDLEVTPTAVIAQTVFAPGAAERDALLDLSRDLTGDPWGLPTAVESGPDDIVGIAAWVLVGVSGAIALTASAIAIGLARIDGRRDEAILGAMGATRRLRRAVSFWQAVLLAGIGAVVGASLGLLAAGALALPGGPMLFAPPLLQLAIAALGVPLVIAVGAWLLAGRATALPTDRSAIA